ncbi:sickie isoform 4-T4 [Cochliomyia hominivorax]
MADAVCINKNDVTNVCKISIENNNLTIKASNDNQQQITAASAFSSSVEQQQQQQHLDCLLKSSIYDWDSPSSFTGTVKRRPHTIANFECTQTINQPSDRHTKTTDNGPSEITANNNVVLAKCQNKSISSGVNRKQKKVAGHFRRQSIHNLKTNKLVTPNSSSLSTKNMQKSSRSQGVKEKPQKLRLSKNSDRNANSTSNSPTHITANTAQGGTIRKTAHKRTKYSSNDSSNGRGPNNPFYQDENYMEFELFEREIPNREIPQFRELFRDFPVSYETTTLAIQSSSTLPAKPPPYRDPPPPTPPPLSQLPSRNLRNNENTQSCPSTPFRGKVVLSKKERKELSKLQKQHDTNCSNSTSNIRGLESHDSTTASAHSSPYKGRVTELKNCIARINSKGLFASLHRNSQKSLNNQTQNPEEQTTSSNETSPPPPAPENSPPGSNASNNNDADYTEKLKNLPVRQRKAHTSYMDNYCLFDPMDFVNEKALRRRTHETLNMDLPLPQQQQGLRDPLFSSRQNLDFSEEELVPEVIYDEEKEPEDETLEVEVPRNFDHHNYFVIDPEDFEEEPVMDIGIPNPFTNEQLVQANLVAHSQHTYANNPADFKTSESLEKLLNAFESASSMSNSQESKDTNTQSTTCTTTTSTALVESSTSTNSNTSSTSNTSSQTTLQRAKKRLTFRNLSPFRSHKGDKTKTLQGEQPKQERAMSELVTSEHMFHLQRMLLSADNVLQDTRPINENIELNYVLFNPGPVPSRNVQYKIRKPRPLSTHSDADSGFLSPCSPDDFTALKFNPALLVLQQCDSVQGYIEIYTDWANYYLERSKSKKKVTDLSSDCRDGLLLAEVIEAVTSFKVPDLHKKPKNQQQMYDNVNSCLNVLRSQTVSGLDNITTNDICCGRLKAVLALFFALSRYKQQSKQSKCNNATSALTIKADIHLQPNTNTSSNNASNIGVSSGGEKVNSANSTSTIQNANVVVGSNAQQQQQQHQQQKQQQHVQSIQNGNDTMVNRQIPQAYTKANGTAIPLPATVMVQRRCPPDKVRPLPPTPNHTPSIPGLGKSGSDFNSSRPNSPPSSNHSVQSLKSGNNNGLRPPSIKSGIPAPGTTITPTVNGQQKHSMLDKLKLFNKEKSSQQQQQQQTTLNQTNKNQMQSKRTSSSSGFSSARSERSDSSLSLNDGHISQIKPPTVSLTSANKNRTETKGKQTNLLKQQNKKEQVKSATKLDKKEKSPARSLHKEDTGIDSRSSTLNRSKNSLTRTGMSNDKTKTSSRTSLNNKSESKTSLIMPPSKTLNSPNGTALPKPIAAIKGTSKLQTATDNKSRLTNSNSSQDMILKREKSDISNAQQHQQQHNISQHAATANSLQQQQHQQPPTHIVKPVTMMAETQHKSPYYANTTSQQHSSPLQEPIYSRLPPPKTALGTPSSIRKLEYNSGPGVLQPQQHSPLRTLTAPTATHSQPVTPTTQPPAGLNNSAANKFHTIPSKIVGTIYEEDKPVNVQPMRPLLRGYNSHVTLPTRGSRGTHHYVQDFCENDLNQGYCSDGDSLRFSSSRMGGHQSPLQGSSRFHDIDNGYLSEGSSGIGLSQNTGHASHGKHFLSMMRARSQLPTTIEERIRNSRGSLDSIGTAAPSSAASQASSSGGSNPKMDMTNGLNGSGNNSANNSPQHHHSSPSHHRSSSRNGRDNWSKMPEPMNGQKSEHKEKSSPSRRSLSGSNSKQGSPSSSRTKGVPPSFGYVKRSNGCNTATAEQQNIAMMMNSNSGGNSPQNGRTAHVSAVPRTSTGGRKVQGGTQTLPHEVSKMPPNPQHRSYSLTGPGATQLSQCIRERLAGSHSLPKQGTDMHMFQHRLSNRPGKMLDGSLSDTQTYAEVKPEYSSYAMWLKHSNTAGSRLSEGDSMENMQIGSPSMSRHNHKMMQHRAAAAAAVAAANAAANPNNMTGTESPYVQSPRLNRSNSIRGPEVEIEPYYCLPVGAQHNGVLSAQMAAAAANAQAQANNQQNNALAWSQPTSPTPITRGFSGPMSPTHANTMPGMQGVSQNSTASHRLTYPKKNDEVHGSTASLLSGGSSLYGTSEERQAQEIRRLKRELMEAREQVLSLSGQLSTNAHVVAAFEQSLSNMTSRLQHLTATAERKDGELTDMRQTIELLRKQSIQAGLTTAHMQSMGVQTQSQTQNDLLSNKPPPLPPSMPGQHMSRAAQHLQQQQTGTNGQSGAMQRHHSSDSMCSVNSIGSSCSTQDKKQKKKGWLRSSFTKAFSRNAKISKTSRHVGSHNHSGSQASDIGSHASGLNRPNGHGDPPGLSALATQPAALTMPASPTKSSPAKTVTLIDNAKPIDAIDHDENTHVVEELKKQLREKDLVLTDIRLEALSSASQLESLKETVNKMRAEMMSLKQNNERLQKLVTSRSLAGSEASLGNAISPNGSIGESRRYSLADGNSRPPMELPKRLEEEVEEENIPPAPAPEPPPPPISPTTHIDLTPPPPALEAMTSPAHIPTASEDLQDVSDGKKIAIACYLGQPESFGKYCEEMLEVDDFYANSSMIGSSLDENGERKAFPTASPNEFVIAYTYISGKTSWQNLDYIVRKTFKDYVSRIDPGTNLGLNTDSITSYHLGEAKRGPEMGFPELLPCGYIIGNVRTLYICLQGVGSLAFDSLIPRSIVHRYISLLTEHRRLILCGPSGTGKSYLARRLAEFLVARSGRGNPSEAIATFNVDHKSSKELRQYLGHIAEQAAIANGASELPSVIILDNLHHASALGDVFSCLLSAGPAAKLPCIIGTMSQATCNTTNLQLHHNFRWVLTANHMEPVKGFLGRFLRRRLFQLELQTQHPQPELASVLAWLPTVWQHINRFLEAHSSSDVTIGPRLFLACPLDLKESQVWFTDIWNYHLSPYLIEAVREGVQLYGRRGGAWNDPSAFIRNSYPWPYGSDSVPPLRQINAEDVGLEGVAASNGDQQDPLLNMLMRLQEAANYSENQDQESDCASLDSNITPDSSAGAE